MAKRLNREQRERAARPVKNLLAGLVLLFLALAVLALMSPGHHWP